MECIIGCKIVGWVFDIVGGEICECGFFWNVFIFGLFFRLFEVIWFIFLVNSFFINMLVLLRFGLFVRDDLLDEGREFELLILLRFS